MEELKEIIAPIFTVEETEKPAKNFAPDAETRSLSAVCGGKTYLADTAFDIPSAAARAITDARDFIVGLTEK